MDNIQYVQQRPANKIQQTAVQKTIYETSFKHHHWQLLIRKKNMKLKKYRSTGNKTKKHNTWYIGKVMGTNMINGLWN